MRIRKILEYNSEYYQIDKYNINKLYSIPKNEMLKIIDIFPDLRLPNSVNFSGKEQFSNPRKIIYGKGSNRLDLEVTVDNDEWYYLKVYNKNKTTINVLSDTRIYKCDQFYGLIKCIKDVINNQ